jgi:hypothetical protein
MTVASMQRRGDRVPEDGIGVPALHANVMTRPNADREAPMPVKTRTLVAHQRYYGLDPVQLRTAAGRVITRVVGLSPTRARVRADHVRQDFAMNTVEGTALVHRLVDDGLLKPHATQPGDYELTDAFREVAAARVVEPLPRGKARVLLARAAEIAAEVNADWHRNPLEIEAIAVSGSYMSREPKLADLTLGVVVRHRSARRRPRWGRMEIKPAGAQAIRAALQALSSFVAVHCVTEAAALPRPFAIVFRDDPA